MHKQTFPLEGYFIPLGIVPLYFYEREDKQMKDLKHLNAVLSLPNLDAEKFKECTEIDVAKPEV